MNIKKQLNQIEQQNKDDKVSSYQLKVLGDMEEILNKEWFRKEQHIELSQTQKKAILEFMLSRL